jgi:hypothetical protein
MMKLYLRSPTRLHGFVLKELSTETTLHLYFIDAVSKTVPTVGSEVELFEI